MSLHPLHRQSGRLRPIAAILLTVAVIAGIGTYVLTSTPATPAKATVVTPGIPLPEFDLVAGDGGAFTRDSFEGRWSWLFFGFTHCPDICPATLHQLSLARQGIDSGDALAIVFVSVDPERDTAEAVNAYATAFGDGITGVTGNLEEIEKLTGPLGIYHARVPDTPDTYQVEHGAAVLLINPDAEMQAVFSSPHEVAVLASDTTLIMEQH